MQTLNTLVSNYVEMWQCGNKEYCIEMKTSKLKTGIEVVNRRLRPSMNTGRFICVVSLRCSIANKHLSAVFLGANLGVIFFAGFIAIQKSPM